MLSGTENNAGRKGFPAALCTVLLVMFSVGSYSNDGINNRTQASARINIQLIIPRSVKLQSRQARTAAPHFLFQNHDRLNRAEFCFRQRGIPHYQLLVSGNGKRRNHLLKTTATGQASNCYLPFNDYTPAQLAALQTPQNNQLILTVAPL